MSNVTSMEKIKEKMRADVIRLTTGGTDSDIRELFFKAFSINTEVGVALPKDSELRKELELQQECLMSIYEHFVEMHFSASVLAQNP